MTNIEKKTQEPDMADAVLGTAIAGVRWLCQAPALMAWAIGLTVLSHPWDRGDMGPDWGAVITLGTPVFLLVLIASRLSYHARRALPWGDLYGPRKPKTDLTGLSPDERKWAREATRNWTGHASSVGLGVTVEDKKGNKAPRVPRLERWESDPLGLSVVVRPLGGQPVDQLLKAAPGLETCWGSEVRATREGTRVRYTLVWHDVLDGTRAVDTTQLTAPEGWLQ